MWSYIWKISYIVQIKQHSTLGYLVALPDPYSNILSKSKVFSLCGVIHCYVLKLRAFFEELKGFVVIDHRGPAVQKAINLRCGGEKVLMSLSDSCHSQVIRKSVPSKFGSDQRVFERLSFAIWYYGWLLKISFRCGWFWIKFHSPISIFLRLGEAEWCCGTLNSEFYWKPIKLTQNWRNMIKTWNPKN